MLKGYLWEEPALRESAGINKLGKLHQKPYNCTYSDSLFLIHGFFLWTVYIFEYLADGTTV